MLDPAPDDAHTHHWPLRGQWLPSGTEDLRALGPVPTVVGQLHRGARHPGADVRESELLADAGGCRRARLLDGAGREAWRAYAERGERVRVHADEVTRRIQ